MKGLLHNLAALLCLLLATGVGATEHRWASVTMDNDLFVGDDSGYTNGLYYSSVRSTDDGGEAFVSGLLKPLLWTISDQQALRQASSLSIAQSLSTPMDISLSDPPADGPPYAALLFMTRNYVKVVARYADQLSLSLGVVGPIALGGEAQTLVHRVTGSEKPQGWRTQIGNEPVFMISRGRLWRNWSSDNGAADVLSFVGGNLGTIQTSFDTAHYWRYGTGLQRSFAIPLMANTRIANPMAVDGSWFVYAGLSAGVQMRFVFLDGNTFRDSRSKDYRHEYLGVAVGVAYAWKNVSFSFAIRDDNLLEQMQGSDLKQMSQFGSFSIAWRR